MKGTGKVRKTTEAKEMAQDSIFQICSSEEKSNVGASNFNISIIGSNDKTSSESSKSPNSLRAQSTARVFDRKRSAVRHPVHR